MIFWNVRNSTFFPLKVRTQGLRFLSLMASLCYGELCGGPGGTPSYKASNRYVQAKSLFSDSECLKECQKQLRSLYQTKNRVKIVPWNQINAVHIDENYTDLSWVMDHRKPKGVTKKELNHWYVPPQRVGFLRRFGPQNGYRFCTFWSGIGYSFRGTYGSAWTYLSFPDSKWIGKKDNMRIRDGSF